MEGDSWRKNQLRHILENDDYLRALLHRHHDVYGALQEIIDRFDVHPGEDTGDLLHSLRLIWQDQHLNQEFNLLNIIDEFLDKEQEEVTRVTWRRYLSSLQIFYNYLTEHGELDARRLAWSHFEEFFSWWYLRCHLFPSKKELKGLFPTLKKFTSYLEERIQLKTPLWMTREANTLKKDLFRILDWDAQQMNSGIDYQEEDEEFCWEGYFQVIMALSDRLGLLDINTGDKVVVKAQDTLLQYLRMGDIFSAAILAFDDELVMKDEDIYHLYPSQALPYIR